MSRAWPVERAWPFEEVPEGGRSIRTPEEWAAYHGDGAEAVVVRIGLHDAQLVLVARSGAWQRWVFHTVEEAEAAASGLGIPVHVGEYPEELRVRINAYVRPGRDFDAGAYPEQGHVGPVLPYPENRGRRRTGQAQAASKKPDE